MVDVRWKLAKGRKKTCLKAAYQRVRLLPSTLTQTRSKLLIQLFIICYPYDLSCDYIIIIQLQLCTTNSQYIIGRTARQCCLHECMCYWGYCLHHGGCVFIHICFLNVFLLSGLLREICGLTVAKFWCHLQ